MEHDQHQRQRIDSRQPQEFSPLALVEQFGQADVGHAVGTDAAEFPRHQGPRRQTQQHQAQQQQGPARIARGLSRFLRAGTTRSVVAAKMGLSPLPAVGASGFTHGQVVGKFRPDRPIRGTGRHLRLVKLEKMGRHNPPATSSSPRGLQFIPKLANPSNANNRGKRHWRPSPGRLRSTPCRRSSSPWPPIRAPGICDP